MAKQLLEEHDPVRERAREIPLATLEAEIEDYSARLDKFKSLDDLYGGYHGSVERTQVFDAFVARVVVREERVREERNRPAEVDVEFGEEMNEWDRYQDCVIARCLKGNFQAEPVWGTSDRSVTRAMIRLNEICECGSKKHKRKA